MSYLHVIINLYDESANYNFDLLFSETKLMISKYYKVLYHVTIMLEI